MVKRIALIILLFPAIAYAQYEHTFFTGDQFGVRWDASTLAIGYYWHIDRVADAFVIAQDTTSELEVHLNIQSAGTYVFYCRAWNFAADGITIQYSGWSTSLTHGRVDGVVQPWQIVIKLKSVGPLIIDDQWGP